MESVSPLLFMYFRNYSIVVLFVLHYTSLSTIFVVEYKGEFKTIWMQTNFLKLKMKMKMKRLWGSMFLLLLTEYKLVQSERILSSEEISIALKIN